MPTSSGMRSMASVLMAAEFVLIVAYVAMTSIISLAMFGLGFVLVVLLVFAWIGILGLHVAAILKGINGGRLLVPGVSEYAGSNLTSQVHSRETLVRRASIRA